MTQQPNRPWQPLASAPDDGTFILVGWHDTDRMRSAACIKGIWHGLGAFYKPPDFWREMPPGPDDKPENAELLEACKAMLEDMRELSLDTEGYNESMNKGQAAIDAEGTDD